MGDDDDKVSSDSEWQVYGISNERGVSWDGWRVASGAFQSKELALGWAGMLLRWSRVGSKFCVGVAGGRRDANDRIVVCDGMVVTEIVIDRKKSSRERGGWLCLAEKLVEHELRARGFKLTQE